MLGYAPRSAAPTRSPRTLLIVVAGHAAALAIVLTARSDFAARTMFDPPDVVFVPTRPVPPPPPAEPVPPERGVQSIIDTPPTIVPAPPIPALPVADGPATATIDPLVGPAIVPEPGIFPDPPRPLAVRKAARFATPADEVRPPYPLSKQRLGESASLRLTLAIDASGRVTSVVPVGEADSVFLDAARRHILRHWRYQPAREGDSAVASSVTITLRFKLDD